jgi:hypothetical protein
VEQSTLNTIQRNKDGVIDAISRSIQTKGRKGKRANKFETPEPETDAHDNIIGKKMPLVSIVQDYKELSSTYGKEKLSAFFKDMERHGVKIT